MDSIGRRATMRHGFGAALLKTTMLTGTMLTGVAPAAAQQTAAPAPGVEEIVVTAQKRAENLQDVPISVQVLGTERLDDLQVADING